MCLRQSDLLGHQGASRLVAVLPETTGGDASLLVKRIHALLDPELAGELKFGIASFPDEEVTWVGLEGLALRREAPVVVGAASPAEADRSAPSETIELVPDDAEAAASNGDAEAIESREVAGLGSAATEDG
jgi:hypothetical protein